MNNDTIDRTVREGVGEIASTARRARDLAVAQASPGDLIEMITTLTEISGGLKRRLDQTPAIFGREELQALIEMLMVEEEQKRLQDRFGPVPAPVMAHDYSE